MLNIKFNRLMPMRYLGFFMNKSIFVVLLMVLPLTIIKKEK